MAAAPDASEAATEPAGASLCSVAPGASAVVDRATRSNFGEGFSTEGLRLERPGR